MSQDVPNTIPMDGESLARIFHEAYERLAPNFGYETRPETRAFDPETPNGRLMIAVCEEIVSAIEETVETAVLRQFYDDVCRRAERNMEKTGKLEGAHYAAMRSVLAERGVGV